MKNKIIIITLILLLSFSLTSITYAQTDQSWLNFQVALAFLQIKAESLKAQVFSFLQSKDSPPASSEIDQNSLERLTKEIQDLLQITEKLIADRQNISTQSIGPVLFPRVLKRGDQGDDVRLLQEFLKQNPSIYPEGLVTGYYGQLTEKAVIRLQSGYGLPVSGVFGDATRNTVNFIAVSGEENIGIESGGFSLGDRPSHRAATANHVNISGYHYDDSGTHKDNSDRHMAGSGTHIDDGGSANGGTAVPGENPPIHPRPTQWHAVGITEITDDEPAGTRIHIEATDYHQDGTSIHETDSTFHRSESEYHLYPSGVHQEEDGRHGSATTFHMNGSYVHQGQSRWHTSQSTTHVFSTRPHLPSTDVL